MDGLVSRQGREVVVIGVGQLRNNRGKSPDAALEPRDLIGRAASAAAADANQSEAVLAELDAIGVVQVVSWRYDDLPGDLARGFAATRARTSVSGAGGHQPVAVLTDLAAQISDGSADLALLCGGEAQSSLELLGAHKDAEAATGWSHSPGGPGRFSRSVGGTERMWDLGLVGPTRIYPLWENALRHRLGQTFAEAHAWSAAMYAGFSLVASRNEAAWNPEVLTADDVAEIGPRNRMICYPYPLRMNALNRVDQAAAVLLASRAKADELGIPEERRVYVHSSALDEDCEDVLERPSYSSSVALGQSLDAALKLADTEISEVDVVDLYSCFPIVPKLASLHLGLRAEEIVSATGGLTSFGGAHNNYSSHALIAVARRLREVGGRGLVYANGEYLTKHATAVLGRQPAPFATTTASNADDVVTVDDAARGPARVETYTVEFDRDGHAVRGYVVARTDSGARTGVRVSGSDAETLALLTDPDREGIDLEGVIEYRGDRRLFTAHASLG